MGTQGRLTDSFKTELVARGYAAWNEDDLEGLLALCHPAVIYHASGVFPGMEPVYQGEQGMRRFWSTFREPWSEIKVIPEEIVERGDLVAILLRFEGTGRDGIETSMRFINTVEIRDRRAYRFRALPYSPEAARELGLESG
jgi:ketosteroid isomerase-like protein